MVSRATFLLLVSSALLWGQTQSPSAPPAVPNAPSATATLPPAPVRNFATVTAITSSALNGKSCAGEQEFRSKITSPFIFAGEQIESGAEFVGHIRACNRNESSQLSTAVVIVDSLALPDRKVVPIQALLQAVGEPSAARVLPLEGEGNRFDSTMWTAIAPPWAPHKSDVYDAATKGPSNAGIFDTTTTGVVGLKHLTFENTPAGNYLLWIIAADNDALDLKAGSQLVVRFRLALTAPGHL